ncbi:hypothetical protein EDB89DRAFT_1906433 [Lactarius sanguifluus]|nr:hypothetical protein EDB89DRAFT_1906433 [Lactarius sanguifluus]
MWQRNGASLHAPAVRDGPALMTYWLYAPVWSSRALMRVAAASTAGMQGAAEGGCPCHSLVGSYPEVPFVNDGAHGEVRRCPRLQKWNRMREPAAVRQEMVQARGYQVTLGPDDVAGSGERGGHLEVPCVAEKGHTGDRFKSGASENIEPLASRHRRGAKNAYDKSLGRICLSKNSYGQAR